MYNGRASSCESLTELLVGQMKLFLGSVQIFCPLTAFASFGFVSLARLSLHALKHQQRLSPVLLFWVNFYAFVSLKSPVTVLCT